VPEPLPVLVRVDEGFDHLGGDEVAVELVELTQPEVVAVEVDIKGGIGGLSLRPSALLL